MRNFFTICCGIWNVTEKERKNAEFFLIICRRNVKFWSCKILSRLLSSIGLLLLFFNSSDYVIPSLKHVVKILGVLTTGDRSNKSLFVILFTMNTAFCFVYLSNTDTVRTSRVHSICLWATLDATADATPNTVGATSSTFDQLSVSVLIFFFASKYHTS